ncbi:hypothetical protein ACJMK2_000757 [Sinanodonta woodiana]|uniref:Uncharacterized protein n=1 Tax=Sinanodonta woodiana TaxID=1069815 RepID=A0ABD3XQ91_SINWO
MEGRKLTLVPYKRWMEYHRWQEQRTPHLPPNPHLTEMSQLQHELQSLMDRHDLSETEKSQKYGQLLQRLQLFHQKALDETALPTLKDFKTLMKSPSPLTPVVKTEKGEEEFQTPLAAPISSKIAASLLTPLPKPPRQEMKAWVKKMMSTPPSTEVKQKEGTPEVTTKEVKSEVKQEPTTPAQTFSSSSTPIARRTRKATEAKKNPVTTKSSLSENWVTY